MMQCDSVDSMSSLIYLSTCLVVYLSVYLRQSLAIALAGLSIRTIHLPQPDPLEYRYSLPHPV